MIKIKKNEGSLDRVIRFVLAIIFASLAYFYFENTLAIIFYILSIIFIITAFTGFCGLYTVCKINTIKHKE